MLLNSHHKEPVFLFGDPGHLLKRDRNTLSTSQSQVFFDGELIVLRWDYIRDIRDGDSAALEDGLFEQQPYLRDSYINLNELVKMSIPAAFAVHDGKAIGALRLRANQLKNRPDAKELKALAHHLTIGRAYFDAMPSKRYCLLSTKKITRNLTSTVCDTVKVLEELQTFYQLQANKGNSGHS